jgi:predicted O-methyltransferase YrrM
MLSKLLEKYIEDHTSEEDELLYRINRETNLRTTMPRMLSGKVQGKFLELISILINPTFIVEIGTFTGYSALCLARGLSPNGKLITIENNPEFEESILSAFSDSKYSDKIELKMGNALEVISEIDNNIDLVFIDADKSEYLDYYKAILPKLRKGGLIVADNVLWSGKVLDEQVDSETKRLKAFNEFVKNDKSVEQVMLSVRDGLLMIMKK